jgi:Creatinase/Prolidase N-terminal domain
MRRGLMGLDPEELPQQALAARLARLRAAMARSGLDAFLIYTNLVRPSAVCWLTGFTPYWIESLLLVPTAGAPILATALSKRVSDWIRSTSRVEEIVNTPKPGTAIGQRISASGARRVGVLELDALPAGPYDDVTAAAPVAELVDASALFAAERRAIDDTERKLIARADALALAALDQVDASTAADAGALAGLVEKHARLGGAEEVFVAVAPDLDADRRIVRMSKPVPLGRRFALRTSVAYKGAWVRRIRSFARDAAGTAAAARGAAWLDAFAQSLREGQPFDAQLAAHLKRNLPGVEPKNVMAESCIGSYPLEAIALSGSPPKDALRDGTFIVLSVGFVIDGVPWLGAAPAFVGKPAKFC